MAFPQPSCHRGRSLGACPSQAKGSHRSRPVGSILLMQPRRMASRLPRAELCPDGWCGLWRVAAIFAEKSLALTGPEQLIDRAGGRGDDASAPPANPAASTPR